MTKTQKIYIYDFDALFSEQAFEHAIKTLPLQQAAHLSKYTDKTKKTSRLAGTLLLQKAIELEGIKGSVTRAANGELIVDDSIGVSISYTGNLAACVFCPGGKIGIDLELVLPIDLYDLMDYFSPDEWAEIQHSPTPLQTTYRTWTRKEALLKATGQGLTVDMESVNVLADTVKDAGKIWHIYSPELLEDCEVALACDSTLLEFELCWVNIV